MFYILELKGIKCFTCEQGGNCKKDMKEKECTKDPWMDKCLLMMDNKDERVSNMFFCTHVKSQCVMEPFSITSNVRMEMNAMNDFSFFLDHFFNDNVEVKHVFCNLVWVIYYLTGGGLYVQSCTVSLNQELLAVSLDEGRRVLGPYTIISSILLYRNC